MLKVLEKRANLHWFGTLNNKTTAGLIATTGLSEKRVRLFKIEEFSNFAQQHSKKHSQAIYVCGKTI